MDLLPTHLARVDRYLNSPPEQQQDHENGIPRLSGLGGAVSCILTGKRRSLEERRVDLSSRSMAVGTERSKRRLALAVCYSRWYYCGSDPRTSLRRIYRLASDQRGRRYPVRTRITRRLEDGISTLSQEWRVPRSAATMRLPRGEAHRLRPFPCLWTTTAFSCGYPRSLWPGILYQAAPLAASLPAAPRPPSWPARRNASSLSQIESRGATDPLVSRIPWTRSQRGKVHQSRSVGVAEGQVHLEVHSSADAVRKIHRRRNNDSNRLFGVRGLLLSPGLFKRPHSTPFSSQPPDARARSSVRLPLGKPRHYAGV